MIFQKCAVWLMVKMYAFLPISYKADFFVHLKIADEISFYKRSCFIKNFWMDPNNLKVMSNHWKIETSVFAKILKNGIWLWPSKHGPMEQSILDTSAGKQLF